MLELKPERLGASTTSRTRHLASAARPFVADPSGALYWPSEDALIVADLHLEKGSAFAERGQMLPPYDTRETLAALAAADRPLPAPSTVIALGDSLHESTASARIGRRSSRSCACMQEDREWIWVTGNHDPEVGEALGGTSSAISRSKASCCGTSRGRDGRHARDRRAPASGGKVSMNGHACGGRASSATGDGW